MLLFTSCRGTGRWRRRAFKRRTSGGEGKRAKGLEGRTPPSVDGLSRLLCGAIQQATGGVLSWTVGGRWWTEWMDKNSNGREPRVFWSGLFLGLSPCWFPDVRIAPMAVHTLPPPPQMPVPACASLSHAASQAAKQSSSQVTHSTHCLTLPVCWTILAGWAVGQGHSHFMRQGSRARGLTTGARDEKEKTERK